MLGSAVMTHRQDGGLQKLSALAGLSHSSLGPLKRYKFIQDEASGESTLAGSCFRIFESLELTCAVGQLVYETLQAHQKVYRTGTGCLLFLAGAWSRAALACLQSGISVAHIVSAMSEGMETCLDVCRESSVSTEGLGVERSKSCTATSRGFGSHLKPVAASPRGLCHLQQTTERDQKTRRKLRLSRHMCDAKSDNDPAEQPKHPNIAHIAEGLSHGRVDAMNLVVEASRIQSQDNQQDTSCSLFDVTKVMTCVLPGPPEETSCVLPGCIVLLSAEQASVAHRLKDQRLKFALINGDLSDTYRHLGYKRPTGITRVSDRPDLSGSSREEEWTEKVVALLVRLDVKLVLVGGLVSDAVILRCCRRRILAVGKAKASVLRAFADATGAVPVAYATQLTEHCVGTGAKVAIWRDLGGRDGRPQTTVNISAGGKSALVTAILTSCVAAKLQVLEDQFWACAYRLHHALTDKVVLPGAGATEMLAIHRLQKQAERHVKRPGERSEDSDATASNPYRGVVLRLMADGLIDYVSTVMVNTGGFSHFTARTAVNQRLQVCNESEGLPANSSRRLMDSERDAGPSPVGSGDASSAKIYDNLSVKREAWRRALDLVFLVLQTDAEVITGVDQMSDGAREDLMLL